MRRATMRRSRMLLAIVILCGMSAPADAADPRAPDWPCPQIKVPAVSLAAVWSGPPIDDGGAQWRDDPVTAELVARLAARRTPIDQARESIADHVAGDAAERSRRGRLLFAGLFSTLDRQRSEVIADIERYTRRQRAFAESIRADAERLRALQGAAEPDRAAIDGLTDRIAWGTRIFEERRKTIGFVCEVPVAIERRLFALGRAIVEALE